MGGGHWNLVLMLRSVLCGLFLPVLSGGGCGQPARGLHITLRVVGFSAGGEELVFLQQSVAQGGLEKRPTGWDLYRMARDGTEIRRLTTTGALGTYADVSARAGLIACSRVSPGARCEIAVLNLFGELVWRVPTGKWTIDLYPHWSPDGRRLAFIRSDPSDRNHWPYVWIITAFGDRPRKVSRDSVSLPGYCWSHDGQAIFYCGRGTGIIHRVSAEAGTKPIKLARVEGARYLALSPTGRLLAVWSLQKGLFMIDLRDSTVSRLAETTGYACWTPDGSHLLFTKRTDAFQQVFSFDPIDSEVEALTGDPYDSFAPICSSRHEVFYLTSQQGIVSLWRMNLDGSGKTRVYTPATSGATRPPGRGG